MTTRHLIATAALTLSSLLTVSSAMAADKVFFESPKNNATVTSPFKVKFGLDGMKIGPLGDMTERTGHHHLIIDAAATPAGQPVPADEKHIHFGKGQTETEVSLPPGKHTLTMVFGNGAHMSYGPGMSSTITVNVAPAK